MSLTTRLSAFFLAALAVVLAGFSVTLYCLVHSYLYRQHLARVEAVVDTLVAVIEIEPDGLDWEPDQRAIALGRASDDPVAWIVRDEHGRVKGQSEIPSDFPWPAPSSEHQVVWLRAADQSYRTVQRGVQSEADRLDPKKSRLLVVTGILSSAATEATLTRLALTLSGLSIGAWLVAALLGRRLCRRILRPVTEMAVAAGEMSAENWAQRLPICETRDELESLGRAFNDLLTRLQDAFERQRRFTGDASHQLRTPLTAMLGQIEVSLRRTRGPDEYQQTLDSVRQQAERLRGIVEMLLFLARADGEGTLSDPEEVELATWIEEYLSRWDDHPRRADMRIELASSEEVMARVHPALLAELLNNLLENACKYSAPGTPIEIRIARTHSMVTCTVVDSGIGIPAEDLPHVFEPFYRSRQARQAGMAGVGLGLAVAQRIAKALGGTLQVRSELGHGSQFVLLLMAPPNSLADSPSGLPKPGLDLVNAASLAKVAGARND